MKLLLLRVRDTLRDSFWFIPLVMALLAAGAALGSVALDHAIGDEWVRRIAWVWAGGPDGARSVLSTVAGSLMTVISIVFSLTITTLAQTSSHFGPRVLRNFTSHRGVQLTLGTFIATFIYCLLVLRTVRSVEESRFVPYLSVNFGVLFTLVSLGVLIFYIHHISQSIQAETLTADVGRAILRSIPHLFPERRTDPGHNPASNSAALAFGWAEARVLRSERTGYVQNVDESRLVELAVQYSKVIRLRARAGDFLWSGSELVDVLPASPVSQDLERRLAGSFNVGNRRTPTQDPVYSMQQLVEIAAHALSPGINEPLTALNALDWLGAALSAVAARDFPPAVLRDAEGDPRVFVRTLEFAEVARAAFDQIRSFGHANADIMLRLLEIIAELVPRMPSSADVSVLAEHANLVAADSARIVNASDRVRVLERYQKSLKEFDAATVKLRALEVYAVAPVVTM